VAAKWRARRIIKAASLDWRTSRQRTVSPGCSTPTRRDCKPTCERTYARPPVTPPTQPQQPIDRSHQPVRARPHREEGTGAGEDNGIDHHQKWLRFPYDSTCLRSQYLHPHPYVQRAVPPVGETDLDPATNGVLLRRRPHRRRASRHREARRRVWIPLADQHSRTAAAAAAGGRVLGS
jgi:hypothetical protein